MRAWLFQNAAQVRKLGDDAPWIVGYYDPSGKKRSKTVGSKSKAEKFSRKIEGQLAAGVYQDTSTKLWAEFRKEYEAKIMPRQAAATQRANTRALKHFQRIVKPGRVSSIRTEHVDAYVSARSQERGKKPDSICSPATINMELRHLKAILRIANDWGYLSKVPKLRKVREEEKIGRVVTPEHFDAIYGACGVAELPSPSSPGVVAAASPADWWRALLAFAIGTGWRIEEILSLRRTDLDLETGKVLTRAADNKGKRDDTDYLPAAVLPIVRKLAGTRPLVFWWPHERRELYNQFHAIQEAAGIRLECPDAEQHTCTPSCHWYGFHALRRGYATLNASTLPAPVLQKKMRHKSFTTTLRYIGLADKMQASSAKVTLPGALSMTAS